MPVQMQVGMQNIPDWMQKEAQEIAGLGAGLARQAFPKYDINKRIVPMDDVKGFSEALNSGLSDYKPGLEALIHSMPNLDSKEQHISERDIANRMAQSLQARNAIEAIYNRAQRTFNRDIMPQIEARFLRLGQHGSSRHADFLRRAGADVAERLKEVEMTHQGKMWDRAARELEAEKARKFESTRLNMLLPSILRDSYNDVHNRQLNIYMMKQAERQRAANMAYDDFIREQMWPQEQLSLRASLLHGMPYNRQSIQYSHVPVAQEPRMNFMGQLGAGAANLLALQNLLSSGRG